jgi:hypothetical protein
MVDSAYASMWRNRRLRAASGGELLDPGQRPLEQRAVGAGEAGVRVWWLGVHGGAGESTLARLFRGTRAAEHRWPVGSPDGAKALVVLVARTSFWGMTAVQGAMREWDQRQRAEVFVLGLVLIAHRPGRLPKDLLRLQRDLQGATEQMWLVPWCERWSAGEIPSRANSPKAVEALCAELSVALGRSARKVGV